MTRTAAGDDRCVLSIALLLAATLLMNGCSAREPAPEPVPVDRVQCAHCRMMISTEIGSAQIVSAREDTRFYDDIACLAGDWPAHAAAATAYVRVGSQWIDARHAWYARAGVRTPMNSGLVAFATRDAAAAGATALEWTQLLEQ